jgi:hypothetical protein
VDKSKLLNKKERLKHLEDIDREQYRMPLCKLIDDAYAVRPVISPDGRTLALPSKYSVLFIEPVSMTLVVSIKTENAYYAKMTDYHLFLKHANSEDTSWTIISFKETKKCSNFKSEAKI